jgi:hypothetical protein
MRSSLPEYIQTYSLGSRKAVSDVIVLAKNDVRSASQIAKSLNNMSSLNTYNGLSIRPYSLASFEAFIDFFRDINLKTIAYYDSMNTISVAINSYVNVLNSEISKLEKDINQLQIYVENYGFISGEDDLYNGSFIETFSDDSNSYLRESFQFKHYDKDGLEFLEANLAEVDIVSNTLKSGTAFSSLGITPKIKEYKNNYSQYISSSSDIYNLFSDSSNKSWNTTIKSPSIITSKNEDFSEINYDYSQISGASASLLFSFENPQKMNCVRVSPNLGVDLQVLQVILYSSVSPTNSGSTGSSVDSSETKIYLLDSPLLIDAVKDISFTETLVKSIKIIFNQPKYTKVSNTSSIYENQSKVLEYYIDKVRKSRANKHDKLQDIVYSYFTKRNEIAQLSSNPDYIPNYYSYRYPCEETYSNANAVYEFLSSKNNFVEIDNKKGLKNSSEVTKIVQSIVSYVIGERYRMSPSAYIASKPSASFVGISSVDFLNPAPLGNIQSPHGFANQDLDQFIPMPGLREVQKSLTTLDKVNYYEYILSVKSIKFGIINAVDYKNESNKLIDKSYFISKMINTNGYINNLKIKSDYFIPKNANSTLDLTTTAAIEFDVSLNVNAQVNTDWVPILPNGEKEVEAEKLFPYEGNGLAKFRFPAIRSSLKVYENGRLMSDTRINSSDSDAITQINIIDYNKSNIYVAKYTVSANYNPNEIDFSQKSIQSFSLKTYSDKEGLGEKLSTVGLDNRAELSFDPYIDYSKFSNHIYSSSAGTIGSGGTSTYSPVAVILEDGSAAINLTNYLPNKYVKYILPINSDTETYFIQNGNSLVFSKSCNNFKVYYDYIPESLRYKVVLRNLDPSKQSSAYVDNIVLKYQQKNTDNFTNKLLKVV